MPSDSKRKQVNAVMRLRGDAFNHPDLGTGNNGKDKRILNRRLDYRMGGQLHRDVQRVNANHKRKGGS